MSTQKQKFELFARLGELGFTYEESVALRRIEMTLSRWAEAECNGEIQRREPVELQLINWPNEAGKVWLVEKRESGLVPIRQFSTNDINNPLAQRALVRERELNELGKPYRVYEHSSSAKKWPIADREAGALRRLKLIVDARNERQAGATSKVIPYHQTDPRGCSLYLVRDIDLPLAYFKVVQFSDGFSIARADGSAYGVRLPDVEKARAFAESETLNAFYTRGLAVWA